MSKVSTEVMFAESVQRIIDETSEVIAQLELPNELIEAETKLSELREIVSARFMERRGIALATDALSGDDDKRRLIAARTALDQAEHRVRDQEAVVSRMRDQHSATIAATLAPYRQAANVAALAAATILKATGDASAKLVHRKMAPAIDYDPALEVLAVDINRAQRGILARREAALDRAIAKLARTDPLHIPGMPEPAPMSGKIPLDRFAGPRLVEVPNMYRANQDDGSVTPKTTPLIPGGNPTFKEAAQSAIQTGIAMLRGGSDPK